MKNFQKIANSKNDSNDYRLAKDLRKTSSLIEQKIWHGLRQLPNKSKLKFRRQHPIHPYIVDFVCLPIKLVIELDGDSHLNQQAYDVTRDLFLKQNGYSVMHFSNQDVMQNTDGVIETIWHEARKLAEVSYVPLP